MVSQISQITGPMGGGGYVEWTHHRAQHAQNLTALIVHNALLLLVVQHGDSKTSLVVGFGLEVYLAQVSEVIVDRVWDDILAVDILFICSRKAPA